MKLRSRLKEQIETDCQFAEPLQRIKHLQGIFTHIPLTLRTAMKTKIFEAIEGCAESPEAVAIFVILLHVLELSTIRNADRCDLESADIMSCLPRVNSLVSSLTNAFLAQRCNLLSLSSWCIGVLVYTYRQCLIWCFHQDCVEFSDITLEGRVPLDPEILTSPSLPHLVGDLLNCQSQNVPPPVPKGNYSLLELVLASAFSNFTRLQVKSGSKKGQNKPLENKFDLFCSSKHMNLQSQNHEQSSLPLCCDAVHDAFVKLDLERIAEHLKIVERKILDNVQLTGDFKQVCKECIQSAPTTLITAANQIKGKAKGSESLYCALFCGFLRLWIYALDRRLVIEDIPQSYLYLSGFVNARFQVKMYSITLL